MASFAMCALVQASSWAAAAADDPRMGTRRPNRETVLVEAGQAKCKIIYPGTSDTYLGLARHIGDEVRAATGCALDLVSDTDSVQGGRFTLKHELRASPALLLGSINSNRAVVAQYAGFRCAADAAYPADDGYVLRTISNPYGTGQNQILVGASTDAGARRGVAAFVGVLRRVRVRDGRFVCPHLLVVEAGPQWSDVLKREGEPVGKGYRVQRATYTRLCVSALRYQWSGRVSWARRARDYLLAMLAAYPDHLPDAHYDFHRIIRAWDMVEDSGVFSPEEMTAVDNWFLRTTLAFENAWWRGKRARRTIGSRHGTAGTTSFHLMLMHLLRCGTANAATRERLLRWRGETENYLHSVGKHFHNPHDSATALDAISDTYWYSLEFGDADYFTSGCAHNTAAYALMCWDNMGYAAGIDGYEAALPGYVRTGRGLGLPLAVNAFVYQDGRYKRLLRTLPNTTFSDYFMPRIATIHGYATGPELPEREPHGLVGVTTLPVVEPRYEGVSKPPYDRITRGVGPTSLPYERTVNKLCFRTGFSADDQYLLLQGFQGSTSGTIDGNCIVRFCEAGHIFLFHSTEARTHFTKNGVHVSRGHNPVPPPAACSLDVCVDLPAWGLTTTTLPDCHGSDWERHVLWRKRGPFVVLDRVRFKEADDFAVSCNWRTPQHATWDGARWHTTHNGDTFVLRPAASASVRARREELVRYGSQMGATAPWVLRQLRRVAAKRGDETCFANVFYVVRRGQADRREARQVSRHEMLLRERDRVALYGVKSDEASALASLRTDAALYVIGSDAIVAACVKTLAVAGLVLVEADRPVDIELEMDRAQVALHGGSACVLGQVVHANSDARVSMPKEWATRLARELGARWRETPAPAFTGSPRRPGSPLRKVWQFDDLIKAPEALPVRRVTCSVPAERDWPVEAVVDTLVPLSETPVWSLDKSPVFDLDLGDTVELAEIRIVTRGAAQPIEVEAGLDDGALTKIPVRAMTYNQNLHKGSVRAATRYLLDLAGRRAARVRLKLTGPGRMAIDEIEIGRQDEKGALVTHVCTATLARDAAPALLLATDQRELVALGSDGRLIWRRQLDQPISAVSALDCSSDGVDSVFVATHAADVRRFDAAGAPVAGFRHDGDMAFGSMTYCVSAYQPKGEPLRLVLGHYHYVSVVDPATGKRLHSQRTGGAYCRAATPPVQVGEGTTAYIQNSWTAAVAALGPGVQLRRLKGLREHVRLFETAHITGSPMPELVEVTDESVRLHELPSGKELFTLTPLSPIGAATVLDVGGAKQVVLALSDGFLLFVDATGKVARKAYIAEGATGAASLGDWLVLATPEGLLTCDASGTLLGSTPGAWLGVKSLPGMPEPLVVAWTTRGGVVAYGR